MIIISSKYFFIQAYTSKDKFGGGPIDSFPAKEARTLLKLKGYFNPSGVASDGSIIMQVSYSHLVIAFCALNSFVIVLP